jgi:biopolymer transport protein ExbB/TolQ
MENETLWQMLVKGGPTMLVLAICSILSWVVILERWWKFRGALGSSERLVARVCKLVHAGRVNEASVMTQSEGGSLASVLNAGLNQGGKDRRQLEEVLERRSAQEVLALEHRLGILGTLGSTAPYIGLFGTVLGVIRAFQALSSAAQAGANVVSAGIAEALVCTAAGLAVAVPSVIAYNAFVKKTARLDASFAIASSELVQAFFDKSARAEAENAEI